MSHLNILCLTTHTHITIQSATKKNVDVSKLLDAARGGNIRDAVDLIKNKGLDVDTNSRVILVNSLSGPVVDF